jgi:beta-1,2-mannobiose phosphorylase / 1,2-beta-oligomannan phosphorylase
MLFADDSRGKPYSKDPAVVALGGRYLMDYSLPPFRDGRQDDGWRIGIAASSHLDTWQRIGEIPPLSRCDRNGLCAPGAIVLSDHVHLFYQTYGTHANDVICHVVSADGISFLPNRTNPIFAPTGSWTCGRAIDADVIAHEGLLFLYFSTRDPGLRIQMTGVATAPLDSGFSRDTWTRVSERPLLPNGNAGRVE